MLLATAVGLIGALLGVDSGRVMPLEPETLRPLSRGAAVGSLLGPVAWAPDRRRVALAVQPAGRVQIVGGRTVATGTRPAWLAWAGQRVFSVGGDGAVAVVDPSAGRVVARAALSGRVVGAQAAGARLVVLLEDRLAIVAARGDVRTVPLRAAPHAGLAVSARAAYVVDPAGVLEVTLASGAVTRHVVSARTAKDDRPWRSAALLDDRTLAISGCDEMAADHRGCARPYGLRLVDIRCWTARVLDRRAAALVRSGRTLVLDASAYGEGRRLGLRAYTADGVLRVETLKGHDILAQVAGTHAYAHVIGSPRSATRAIDLRSGATRLIRARVPYLLG